MIVPGYLALHLDHPPAIAVTLLAALVTFAAVRGLSRYCLVYGRRRIVLMLLFGFLIGSLIRLIPALSPVAAAGPWADCFCVVGYLVPGLIALWIDRQGPLPTLAPLMTSAIVVRLVLVVLGLEVVA